MSSHQTYQTAHNAPSEVTLAPSEATLCPSEMELLPANAQQQRQPMSKVLRDKAKRVLKGLADSYIDDAHASSFAKGLAVSPRRCRRPAVTTLTCRVDSSPRCEIPPAVHELNDTIDPLT
ncbi:hypothetical protein HJFPF1_10042 [Paramyrothecium foliicola]|nr:hypothetical protein HJFPF1_10042 [Paramyrothecium foliicola]